VRSPVVALLVVAIAACGGGDDAPSPDEAPTTTTTTAAAVAESGLDIEIVVTGGEPEGGVRTETVDLGDRVTLTITSDTADEVHVHGYDLVVPLVPGEPATVSFDADQPGVWEVELHDAGNVLVELQVG
jgi:nitrous oxide reductase